LDVAQSFTPASSNILTKVMLKLKKVGNPSDLTVRILGDAAGTPDKSTILASGTLYASLVTPSYGFIEIELTSPPSLVAGTTYWIMVDTSSNSSNYWAWSDDTSQGYNGGKAMYSDNWQAAHPTWNPISGDLGFQTYMGGVPTSIIGANGAKINGNVHANTLNTLTIQKGAYFQVEQNITAANMFPGSPDPVAQTMPLSDSNIADWKNQAASAGMHTGDINTCPSSLPSGSYVGSINLPGGCTVTVGTPIWVTGNFNLSNSDIIKLNPSYGSSSGTVIIDGTAIISNGNLVEGTGVAGSYLIFLSTYDSKDDPLHTPAINITNNGNVGIFYSNLGEIQISNNNNLTAVTAWKLSLSNGVTVNYDQGLASTFFSSGPGGSFSAVKGTYQAK